MEQQQQAAPEHVILLRPEVVPLPAARKTIEIRLDLPAGSWQAASFRALVKETWLATTPVVRAEWDDGSHCPIPAGRVSWGINGWIYATRDACSLRLPDAGAATWLVVYPHKLLEARLALFPANSYKDRSLALIVSFDCAEPQA